ncbi:MAG: sugar phosphate isomerase/epimerase family protein [Gemmatimonadales bacterium]|jgi:sugar phosphate isomerase/epimerase
MDRRSFVKQAGVVLAAASAPASLTACSAMARPRAGAVGIGMCDWNLGPMCDPEQIPRAAEADLEGIQVSLGRNPEEIVLRDPVVRGRYLELGRQHGITFHSVALGLLNSYPLAEEPRAAVWVVDALETAVALGAGNVLMAFFGNGDLRFRDENGEFVNTSEAGFASYRLDQAKVSSVVETLKQIVPRARDAGVVLGLENTITARQNLEIIERVGSEWLQVYYDVGNSTGNGYDVPGELRMLGNERICEVHLKDWRTPLLGSEEGMVDMPAAAAALRDIGYDKWLVLETSGRDGRFLEDTRRNVAWARQTFQRA